MVIEIQKVGSLAQKQRKIAQIVAIFPHLSTDFSDKK